MNSTRQKTINYRFFSLVVFGGLVLISSCHRSPSLAINTDPHPLTPYQKNLVSHIRISGAKVIKQGEVLQIVMPTDRFFKQNTTRVKSNKVYAVNNMVRLVKSYIAPYQHPRIIVTGYADNVYTPKVRQQLSHRYAYEMAQFLSRGGVASRWVHVQGAGATQPIASNRTPRGSAYNRRVVVQVN